MFLTVGFTSLLFTFVMLSVKEPVRRVIIGAGEPQQKSIPLDQVVDYIRANQ
jgi:hypothetical protein